MKKKYFITGFMIILGIIILLRLSINDNKDLAVYIENELNSSIPASNENLYVNKIDCDNNVNAYWDNDKWGLFISNLSKKTKCNLYFIHDTQKPYWQIEEVEKTSVLSTDIFTIKISGNDSLSKVTSSLDTSSLSFYVNDTLQSPIKVELTKLEELNKKITYSIKVHMVGGQGNLKLKINSNTLTDNETNQNDETTLDTGIIVSKNPLKILHYYNGGFSSKEAATYYQILNKYYCNIDYTTSYSLEEVVKNSFDVVIFDDYAWKVPTIANDIFESSINIISFGNDSNNELYPIDSITYSEEIGTSKKQLNNPLTNYLPDELYGYTDSQQLINFINDVTVLYKNTTNNNTYDSVGYITKNGKTWFHSQLMSISYLVPIIQFTIGRL